MKNNTKSILKVHEGGKIKVVSKKNLSNKAILSKVYTPGVADVCLMIAKDKKQKNRYTMSGSTIAVVTDGTAVLGLGDIGPEAALPVMEGKSAIFKQFSGLNAFPICLNTKDSIQIISIVKAIAPVFAGVNLEDISAPRCFEIEEALQNIGIPVMHDDQHGTAIVVLAGLINASKVVGKKLNELTVVISGSGAAGIAIAQLLSLQVKNVILIDTKGIISKNRQDLNFSKKKMLSMTNKNNIAGNLCDALENADVFVGVSAPNIVTSKMISKMAKNAIVFALSNPTPEIMPLDAKKGGAVVVATGRSDFPNQINNALAFPGVFKGAVKIGAKKITMEMKIAAANAIANFVRKPTANIIIPSIFQKGLHDSVSQAVARAWLK